MKCLLYLLLLILPHLHSLHLSSHLDPSTKQLTILLSYPYNSSHAVYSFHFANFHEDLHIFMFENADEAELSGQSLSLNENGAITHFQKRTLNDLGQEVNRFELLKVKIREDADAMTPQIEFTLDVCILRDSVEYSNLFVPDDVIPVRLALYEAPSNVHLWSQIRALWLSGSWEPEIEQRTLINFWDEKMTNVTDIEHIIGPYSFIQDTYRLTVFVPYNLRDDSRIIIHMRAKTRGWVGFGIAPLKGFGMANAAMVVGQHSINNVQLPSGVVQHDTRGNTPSSAPNPTPQSIQLSRWYAPRAKQLPIYLDNANEALISARFNSLESMTHFTFKFPINCTREYPIPISLSKDKNRFIIAFSSDDDLLLKYHGPQNRESNAMSFLTPREEPSSQDWKMYSIWVHAVLMIFAWCFCASGGIYTARFLRNRFPKHWVKIHIACQVGTVLGTIFGFIAALAPKNFLLNVEDPHSLIGMLVFLCIFLQTVLGVITDKMREPRRRSVQLLPDKLHWILGRTMWIMALANSLLGLSAMNWHWMVKLSLWLWLAVLVSVFVFSKRVSYTEDGKKKRGYRELRRVRSANDGLGRGIGNRRFVRVEDEEDAFHEI